MTRQRAATMFWLAVLVSLALYIVPGGRLLMYPFALLATWAHEMGHGLTAILVGGHFVKLEIYSNLGGVAFNQLPVGRLPQALTSAGGLLGSAVVGALVVASGSRPKLAVWAIDLLAIALAVSALIWVRNGFGLLSVSLLAAALFAVAHFAPSNIRFGLGQFIGIQLCLGSLSQLDYMFTHSFQRGGQILYSDTQNIAEQLFLPYWFWGGVIALLCLLLLWMGYRIAWGRRF